MAHDGIAAALADSGSMTEAIWFTDALMRIHIPPEQSDGRYALIEGLVPPGHQPPPHIHHDEDEGFFVLEGELTLSGPDGEVVLRPGQAHSVPAGVPHTFRVTSTGPARVVSVLTGSSFVGFLRAVGRPAERLSLPTPAGPPDLALMARAAAAAHMEIVEPAAA